MPSSEDKKDEALTAPLSAGERTVELQAVDTLLEALRHRYDLLRELGRGGMGIVYQARDRETGDIVALKVLQPEIAAQPELIERFKSELLLARKITHKNVCRVYDLNRFGNVAVIAMEYVEGESLRKLLDRVDGLSVHHGLKILRQVLAGLSEAHAQGVVHRDLKPENILIARDGTVKLMDFGIARSLETGATATLVGMVVGTPAYMSPEQAQGQPVDARSDIYSLGLMMYEMFAGQPAFRADTPATMVFKHVHETPAPPRSIEPDLPERIDRAIQKCLEKNPKKRFPSVGELELALSERPEAKAAVAEGAEIPLPVHLTRWQPSDWLLLPLAIAGLLLFFSFFERTSLAPRSRVTFERGALPRIAQEYAQRLGAPLGRDYRISAQPFPQGYDYLATKAGAPAALELTNNPVTYWEWYVEWQHLDREPTQVWVDNRGSLTTFFRYFPTGSSHEKLSVEEAKPLAEKALGEFFNREPSSLRLENASNDTWRGHPRTTFIWVDPQDYYGLQRRYYVRFVGREIATLDRSFEPPVEYAYAYPVWQLLNMFALTLVLVILGVYQRRQVELAARWRTATTALAFVLGIWMSWALPRPTGPILGNPVMVIFGSATFGLALAFFWFFESIALERSVRRVAPEKFSTFVRFFDRRILSEPCGLAILRGTLLGLTLLGVDTFLVSTGTSKLGMRFDSITQVANQVWPYLRSPWTNPHLVLAALLQVCAVGMGIGFLASFLARLLRRTWATVFVAAALAAVFVVHPMISLGSVQPFHWKVVVLFLDYLLLACIFARFDLLTLLAAIFTFAIWWQNYRLLVMFEPTGAGEQWLAFALWGLFVLAAAVIAFRAELARARQRFAASLES